MSESRELLDAQILHDAGGTGVLQALREVAVGIENVHRTMDTADALTADRLQIAGEELHVVEEEMAAQLAEVESVAAAREEERLLTRRLLASLPVPLLATDGHGAILEANTAAAQLLGVDPRDLSHKPLFAFVDTVSRRHGRNLLRDVIRSGGTAEGVLRLSPRTGDSVECQVTVARVPASRTGLTGDPHGVDVVRWVLEVPTGDADGDPVSRATLIKLCRLGIGDFDLRSLLRRVAELSVEGVATIQAASIMLGHPAQPELLASSSSLAQAADGVQHLAGCGPVFEAYTRAQPVGTADLFRDSRWPALSHASGDRSVQGCLVMPLVLDGVTVGVFGCYRDTELDLAQAERGAAPYVAAAQSRVRDCRVVQELRAVRDQLQEALTSRAVIDQAKGMVMITRKCSAEQAFALLTRMSNAGNRKLRDIAQEIVLQGSGEATAVRRRPGVDHHAVSNAAEPGAPAAGRRGATGR
jgi:PAS domain S-box-containing protein